MRVPKLSRPGLLQRTVGNVVSGAMFAYGWVALRYQHRLAPGADMNSQHPLVSVLIPTHNRADLLIKRSLTSVLSQTYRNLEVIVCAHGCTDDTVKNVTGLNDPRVRLLVVPRDSLGYPESAENHWLVGPVRPLNAGTKAARGQLIALLGDDDEWVPDHLEKSVAELLTSGAEWVSGWSKDIDSQGSVSTNMGSHEGIEVVGGVATWVYVAYLRFAKWNIHSWRKGWDRPNDIDLAQRFLKMGVRHSLLPRVGAIWQPRPGETSLGVAAYIENSVEMLQRFAVKPSELKKEKGRRGV